MSPAPWGIQQRFFYDSLIRVAETNGRGQDYGMRRLGGAARLCNLSAGADVRRGFQAPAALYQI
jgi:hypothetical protein